jgi:hypothetical protein
MENKKRLVFHRNKMLFIDWIEMLNINERMENNLKHTSKYSVLLDRPFIVVRPENLDTDKNVVPCFKRNILGRYNIYFDGPEEAKKELILRN